MRYGVSQMKTTSVSMYWNLTRDSRLASAVLILGTCMYKRSEPGSSHFGLVAIVVVIAGRADET